MSLPPNAILLGRVWSPDARGPSVVTVRDGRVIDITSSVAPLVADICAMADPAGYVRDASGRDIGAVADFLRGDGTDQATPHLLAPCDLQAVKACGVTFAGSMVERVIEERAAGDPARAEAIRNRVSEAIGDSLRNLRPGSPEAEVAKQALHAEGLWSQYLEVGIGPDAEVFSKAQVLSSVGHGAAVGLHPLSRWNNPEPEIVLAISPDARIVGASLGNDVNLRDFEGRSALLLSKAKDNNASCAIGPFIRLFDDTFDLDTVRRAELQLRVEGPEGYVLEGRSAMAEISRDPVDLVAQTIGRNHQYPDGLLLFLGTLFAPTEDRDVPGHGFTHRIGDVVQISSPDFGELRNTVALSTDCPEWTYGTRTLMRNLAHRNLI
jgi:fumarylacetoacetate (FAA) hydrolase family protein